MTPEVVIKKLEGREHIRGDNRINEYDENHLTLVYDIDDDSLNLDQVILVFDKRSRLLVEAAFSGKSGHKIDVNLLQNLIENQYGKKLEFRESKIDANHTDYRCFTGDIIIDVVVPGGMGMFVSKSA
jgi:hypothetical protein